MGHVCQVTRSKTFESFKYVNNMHNISSVRYLYENSDDKKSHLDISGFSFARFTWTRGYIVR